MEVPTLDSPVKNYMKLFYQLVVDLILWEELYMEDVEVTIWGLSLSHPRHKVTLTGIFQSWS